MGTVLSNAPETGTLRLVAVGDVMLGDSAICVGYGFASKHTEAALEKSLCDVRPFFESADIGFGNLETVLSERGLRKDNVSSMQMRGRASFARVLRDVGFTVLSVANNHANQHGLDAFCDTVDALRDAGIEPCGLRGSDGWCSRPVIISRRGVTVGFLGYCLRPRQYGQSTPPFAEGSPSEISDDVTRLRPKVNHVVVSLHWGEEFVAQPSTGEVSLAQRLVEAGASLIVGHHPHVVRPVHRCHDAIVAYSLGNFVTDMIWQRTLRTGALLRCTFTADGLPDAHVSRVETNRSFIPRVVGMPEAVGPGPARAIRDDLYAKQVRKALTQQRVAAYRYALSNVWRYPPHILMQLLSNTAKNKVTMLLSGRRA